MDRYMMSFKVETDGAVDPSELLDYLNDVIMYDIVDYFPDNWIAVDEASCCVEEIKDE